MKKPNEITHIFRNDETIDCMTFVLNTQDDMRRNMLDCFGTCDTGRNFSQYTSCSKDWISENRENLVNWDDLNDEIKEHIIKRLK